MEKFYKLLFIAITLFAFNSQSNAQNKISNTTNSNWVGKSFIVVNGNWYNASGAGNAIIPTSFGEFATSFTLGGEVQSYPNVEDGVSMFYKIDGGEEVQVVLPKTGNVDSNSKHFGETAVDISSLADGEHTIEIWFKSEISGVVAWDSRDGQNYKSTFTKKTNTTGLDKISLKKRISVTDGVITVEGVENFEVFSITGQKQDIKSSLKAGIYIVKVGDVAQKVIVK